MNMMSAAVVAAPGEIRIENVPLPEPASNEVRVKLEGCGVCATNLPSWAGMPWFNYPMEPGALGHEGWGWIDAVGSDVKRFKPGERVAFLSSHAYAQYDVASADSVVKLRDCLSNTPFPGEPLGCAMNIFRRSEIREGDCVAIVGIGFLGALLTRLASLAGARVIAVSRRPFSLDVAKSMGAAETIEMNDHYQIIDQVKNLTDGQFCDCTIEAVGKQWPLDLSAELTRERGRMIVAGYHQDGPRQVNMWLWNWRGLDVINAHERDNNVYIDGIRMAADAIAGGIIDPNPLYTEKYPLSKLDEALNATRDRPDGFLKALVMM